MKEEHRNAIENCRPGLIQTIVSSRCLEVLIDHLGSRDQYGNYGLTPENIIEISGGHHTSEATKVRTLLAILPTRGENAFDRFISAVRATNQIGLIEILNTNMPPNQQIPVQGSTSAASKDAPASLLANEQGNVNIVHGVMRVERDFNQIVHNHPPAQPLLFPSPPTPEELKKMLASVQQTLKEIYSTKFRNVNPLLLDCFTYAIENTWVSLTLKEEKNELQATEDHAELLEKAFDKVKMLIIEGDPATGKTSLMRRLAYEWASGKHELLHYDLVLYAEFREVYTKTFKSIADLVLGDLEKHLDDKDIKILRLLLNDEQFCQKNHIMVLLDGYDESSSPKQCSELNSYLTEATIKKPLFYNVVITTRKGPLSKLRQEKRFVFAEVLGFITKQQKDKFIFNHFFSTETDNSESITVVQQKLNNNHNLNKLAETPLFLTFICLVHKRIIDGTILELYCNIIWWLIERRQQAFPNQNVTADFGFPNNIGTNFEIIQEHYLHFSQLHCLGKMALINLQKNVFKLSDCAKFGLQPIIEQVGLLRKERTHDDPLIPTISYFFPHRTIQEFLAAFYCLYSDDSISEWLLPNSKLNTSAMDEFYKFLFRIALSDKMPIQAEKRKYYFDKIVDIELDITFDAFNTSTGLNNELLNWFFSQCTNVQNITLRDIEYSAENATHMMTNTSLHNKSAVASILSSIKLLSFRDLIGLHSLKFEYLNAEYTFETNSQLSITHCSSLKNLIFTGCKIESSTNLGIATLPAIDTVEFDKCTLDLAAWQSITDQINNSKVKCLKLTFGKYSVLKRTHGEDYNKDFLVHMKKCDNVEKIEITINDYTIRQNELITFNDLIKLHSLTFSGCTFSANFELSFTNCSSLKNLKFNNCVIESKINLGIATLPVIDTVQFELCTIDLATWQSITDQINNSKVKCLHLSADYFVEEYHPGFLHHLHKCERIQQIHVNDVKNWSIDDYILNCYEEKVTANLAQTAQILPALTSITISDEDGRGLDESRRLKESYKERIEKTGQGRNAEFSIKYAEYKKMIISQAPASFSASSPQSNAEDRQKQLETSTPALPSASEAAGGQSEHYSDISVPQLNRGNEGESLVRKFDAICEMEKIIRKFDQLPPVKVAELKRPLTAVLEKRVEDSDIEMSTMVDLDDLLNIRMASVLPDWAIQKIRSASRTSDAYFVFCDALTRSGIYGLFMFLNGLRINQQEHLFHLLCTEEFCKELQSILD